MMIIIIIMELSSYISKNKINKNKTITNKRMNSKVIFPNYYLYRKKNQSIIKKKLTSKSLLVLFLL